MKRTLLLLGFMLIVLQSQATIRRVNNNPGVITNSVSVFATFALAHSAAADGDTIYIEPSDINYGAFYITKKLVIVGPGYLLNKNPNTPFDKRSAKVSQITFNGLATNGSKLFGLEIKNTNGSYGNITFTSSGLGMEISNCMFYGFGTGNITEGIVSGCFIFGNISTGAQSIIHNNIIIGHVGGGNSSVIIRNNVILGGVGSNPVATFYNNIIYETNTNNYLLPTNEGIYNNVCVGCTGTPGFNNFFTTAANTIFVVPEPRTPDDLNDSNFQLSVSSPAKGKGIGGVDCGAFAGPTPYVLSGIPPFPMITAFTQGAPVSGNIPITISIKRN